MMITSSLRSFLVSKSKWTTFSRYRLWQGKRSRSIRLASSSSPREEISADHDQSVLEAPPTESVQPDCPPGEKTLPDIIIEVTQDRKLVRNYTDATERPLTEASHRKSEALEMFDKIEDVQKFLDEVNRRRRLEGDSTKTVTGSESDGVTIVYGRDKSHQIDVSMTELMDTLKTIDRTDRKVAEVDNVKTNLKRGRTPLALAAKMWTPQTFPKLDLIPNIYLRLSKSRLTLLVASTAVAGYLAAPLQFDLVVFSCAVAGTCLNSAGANAINQLIEIPFDSQMARTRDRPLVRAQLSPLHALIFAGSTVMLGTTLLYLGVNELVAGLGLSNFLLYTCVYTPMKRFTIFNTWAGAVVGAIPPMMGWAAATNSLDAGAFLVAGLLYSWQFPHFNALSWNLRADYSRAGYCMMSVTNPGLCKIVALRHCVYLHLMCFLAPILDVTTWTFACDSFCLNAIFTYYGWQFYRYGDSKSSRNLFNSSLVYLPVLLLFLIISKKRTKEAKPSENFHYLSTVIGI